MVPKEKETKAERNKLVEIAKGARRLLLYIVVIRLCFRTKSLRMFKAAVVY